MKSPASETETLRAALAETRSRLARPNNGVKPYGDVALTVKQRNDLRAAAKRIANTWEGDGLPDEAWVSAQLQAIPTELRALRPDAAWIRVVRSRKAREEKIIASG